MKWFASNTRFTLAEGCRISTDAVASVPLIKQARIEMGSEFFERIMLAVTEVNGCALCSYGHARAALAAGLSKEDIADLMSGDTASVPADQAPAIAFAQHYAESRGCPDPATWCHIISVYGVDRAILIRAAIRMIMWGNAYGIPASALLARWRGAPHADSSLGYEVAMVASAVPSTLGAAVAIAGTALIGRVRSSWRWRDQ